MTSDRTKRRRTLKEISHIFLSSQGDDDQAKNSTHRAATSSDVPTPDKSTVTEPDSNDSGILPSISRVATGDWNAERSEAPRSDPISRLTGRDRGRESRESVELVIRPRLYPVVTLIWKKVPSHGKSLEANIPLRREVWLGLAKTWKEDAARIDACVSRELTSAWNSVADSITREIRAEEHRERHREAYDSFGDFVANISNRTDLDKIRKAQMIHDKACELKLH